jgi:hypothetical protein
VSGALQDADLETAVDRMALRDLAESYATAVDHRDVKLLRSLSGSTARP